MKIVRTVVCTVTTYSAIVYVFCLLKLNSNGSTIKIILLWKCFGSFWSQVSNINSFFRLRKGYKNPRETLGVGMSRVILIALYLDNEPSYKRNKGDFSEVQNSAGVFDGTVIESRFAPSKVNKPLKLLGNRVMCVINRT